MGKRESGFTLLEVLVAITLMSILVTGLFAMFQGMLKLYSHVEGTRNSTMQTRLLVNLLHDDVASLLLEGGFIGLADPAIDNDNRLFAFVSGVSVSQTGIGPQESLRAVSYRLAPDPDFDPGADVVYNALYRTERPLPFTSSRYKDTPLVLARQVKSCTVRYEDARGEEKESWNTPARSTNRALLPKALVLKLVLVIGDQDVERTLRIPLPL